MAALRWQRLDGCFGVALPKWGAEGAALRWQRLDGCFEVALPKWGAEGVALRWQHGVGGAQRWRRFKVVESPSDAPSGVRALRGRLLTRLNAEGGLC